MVEEEPSQEASHIDADEDVVAPAPAHVRMVLNKGVRNDGTNARAGEGEHVTEGIAGEAVLHGDQLAHYVVVGELSGSGHADDGGAPDQGVDALGSRAEMDPMTPRAAPPTKIQRRPKMSVMRPMIVSMTAEVSV